MLYWKKLAALTMGVFLTVGLLVGCGNTTEESTAEEGQGAQMADAATIEEITPLIDSLCFSEGLHFDAFAASPDEVTTTYTLWHLVTYTDFRNKAAMSEQDGAYYFDAGAESEDAASNDTEQYYGPEDLYADYFTGGQFQYAPPELSFLVEGTQTGVAVHLSDAPYYVETTIKEALIDGDSLYVKVNLKRGTYDEEPPAEIGDAEIVLTKNERGMYGYTVTSYSPEYPAFDSIYLQ